MADDSRSSGAARGVRPVAIRSRIQRKTLRVRPADRENDGRTRVWIADTAGADADDTADGRTGSSTDTATGNTTDHVALLTEIAALRERVGRSESAEAELRARLADQAGERDRLITDRDRAVQELAEERRHARDLAGRLDQAQRDRLADAERHRVEIKAFREELEAERRRPWWRRLRRR